MKKIFFFFFIFFLNIDNLEANDGIYFIDIDYILNNSNAGKIIVSELKDLNSQNNMRFKKKETELKSLEDEIKKIKNIINQDELNMKINNLKKNVTDYRNDKKNILKKYENIKNEKLNTFFKNITPIIEEFMKIRSIKIIFDRKNIFIADSNYDITNDLINFLNEKLK